MNNRPETLKSIADKSFDVCIIGGGATGGTTRELNSGAESIFGFMQTSGSVRIVKAFHKIKSRKARQLLVEMAEEFADVEAA